MLCKLNDSLEIWDTAGQESFRAVTRSYYRGAEGCLLVFDVTNRRSFVDLHIWLSDLQEWAEEKVVIILVGNKVDASTDDSREVSSEEGQEWAAEHGMEYIETSAKTGQGVEEAFEETAKRIHSRLMQDKHEMDKKRKARSGSSFPVLQLKRAGGAGGGCC
ncbi:MAG: hypothetical protein CYPHOPRED_001182 [Cyphobasidiales sp. Tagirdzhanova-0007]|nr:MAG: hypothetical protein CYPHOPRED_001182 [Cyphobasidiales sp. Tagirdzhanova-0007]